MPHPDDFEAAASGAYPSAEELAAERLADEAETAIRAELLASVSRQALAAQRFLAAHGALLDTAPELEPEPGLSAEELDRNADDLERMAEAMEQLVGRHHPDTSALVTARYGVTGVTPPSGWQAVRS